MKIFPGSRDRIGTLIYIACNNSGFVQITEKKLLALDRTQITLQMLAKQ